MGYSWGKSSYHDWTTQDEINWLRGLATRTLPYSERYPKKDYKEVLKDYLKIMPLRVNWGSIDPHKVRDWVMTELGS